MKTRALVTLAAATAAVLSASWIVRRTPARAAAPPNAVARQGIDLTVYPDDFGMVHEARPMRLAAGDNYLQVPEVSRQMDPESVLLAWSGPDAQSAQITAHSYDLGVNSEDGLLKRYLGKQVEVVRYGQNGQEADRQKGRLMVENGGAIVLQQDDRFYVHPEGTIVAPADRQIVTIPQLSVQAHSANPQSGSLDVTYLTRGLHWSADYVATLASNSNKLKLECWATVTNRTGVDYPNARVTLAAGSPNRAVVPSREPARPSIAADGNVLSMNVAMAPAVPESRSEPVITAAGPAGELHQYRVNAPTTIIQEQMNRLLMLESGSVTARRDYNTRLPVLAPYDDFYGWGAPSQPKHGSVAASIVFYNRKEQGLGEPLPAGAIRIYEPDSTGSPRYAGAAQVPDTPEDQRVDLTLANAFDLSTVYRVIKTQKVAKHTVRKQVEVTLRNEKPTSVTVRVVQPFSPRWKAVTESAKHTNLDANTAQWSITVPARGKTELTFTADLAL